jgi:hypothetical protein
MDAVASAEIRPDVLAETGREMSKLTSMVTYRDARLRDWLPKRESPSGEGLSGLRERSESLFEGDYLH